MFTKLLYSARRARTPVLGALFVCVSLSPALQAQEVLATGAESYGPVTPVASPRADQTPAPRAWEPGDPIREVPRRIYPSETVTNQSFGEGWRDPLQDLIPGTNRAPTLSIDLNVAGSGYSGVMPPDTVGDVGPNHFVQGINASNSSTIRVMDKSGNTLVTFPLANLAPSGRCQNDGSGDPIVLYDHLADRWFLQEFTGGNDLCIYISQTPDPTGAYYFYQFTPPVFPDYPHFGVWPDAYYGATNESGAGVTTYAFDRNKMLAGLPATMQRLKVVPKLPAYGFQTLTPVDHDGATPPPAGTSGLFMRHFDDEAHGPAVPATDQLQMFALNVDWTTPANTTVTTLPSITITDFNSWLVNYTTFAAVPQPGSSQRIDPIREAIMNRLAYRNFGTHEAIVGNFVTNRNTATTGSTVQTGIRWFELRRTGGIGNPWLLEQEGTYAGNTNSTTAHFWLGGISQDRSGNIGLGYSKTDTAAPVVFPSIGVTGRLATDAAGTMGSETVVIAGGGSQSGDRWGDYAAMGIDPADDCTFWYTNEHVPTSSWATRVVAFHFEECFSGFNLTPAPVAQQVCALDTPQATFDIAVEGRNGWNGNVLLSIGSGLPAGASAAFDPNNQPADFISELTVGNLGAVASGSYEIQIQGTDGIDQTGETSVTLDLSAALPGALAIVSPANGATDVSALPSLSWSASSDAIEHQVQIATDPGFTDIVYQADVAGTSHDVGTLLSGDTQYYWRVVANNLCGSAASDVGSFRTGLMFCAAPGAALTQVSCVSPTSGSSSSIEIPTAGTITDVDIAVLATHTYVGDLQVRLSRGAVSNRQLINRIANGGGGCDGDDINATLDDEAASPVQTACPPDGTYTPANALDVFDGTELSGTWTLNVRDCASGDNGVFESWCVLPTLEDSDANTPPTFVDDPYSFQVSEQASVGTLVGIATASDVDSGQTLSYAIEPAGNTGNAFAIDANGAIRVATPGAVIAANAPFVLQLLVSDGVSGVDTATATITLVANSAPVLTVAATASQVENTGGAALVASASDAEDDAANLAFGLTGPDAARFQFNAGSGELSFLSPPDFESPLDAGANNVYDVTLTVTDTGGMTDAQAIAITVLDINEAPVFTSTPVTAATQDAVYSAAVTATDPDAGATLTLAATTLPTWLSFTDNGDGTGTLTGTPGNDDAGTHDVVLTLTDGVIATPVEQAFTITVDNVNDAPVAGPLADVSVQFGTAASIDAGAAFTDPDGDALAFAVSAMPELPAAITIDAATGVIGGTPLEADIGSYAVTVTATDPDGEEASVTFTLTVVGEYIFGDGFESP